MYVVKIWDEVEVARQRSLQGVFYSMLSMFGRALDTVEDEQRNMAAIGNVASTNGKLYEHVQGLMEHSPHRVRLQCRDGQEIMIREVTE